MRIVAFIFLLLVLAFFAVPLIFALLGAVLKGILAAFVLAVPVFGGLFLFNHLANKQGIR